MNLDGPPPPSHPSLPPSLPPSLFTLKGKVWDTPKLRGLWIIQHNMLIWVAPIRETASKFTCHFWDCIVLFICLLVSTYNNISLGKCHAISWLISYITSHAVEPALETWAKASLTPSLMVHDSNHTHSLASFQWSGLSDQRALQLTETCLQIQK